MLALSLLFLGDTDGAIEAGRRAAELERTVDALEFLGMALAAAGQVEEARELRDEVLEMAEERYTCPYEVASLLLSLGEVDEALAWFEKAIDERADCFAWGNVDPRLEQLRKDPRFVEQLRRVGHDVTALQ
jgi:tetratricopeptide (TPR) repeat protein